MIKLNVHDAKTHLSRYLARLGRGEKIVLCRRNEPIAEILPLPRPRLKKRRLGGYSGKINFGKEFFEPLPAEILGAFEGKIQGT